MRTVPGTTTILHEFTLAIAVSYRQNWHYDERSFAAQTKKGIFKLLLLGSKGDKTCTFREGE